MALLCGESAPPCWGNAAAVAAAANAGWRPLHWPCGGGTHPPPRPTSLPRSPLSPPPPPQDYHGPDAQLLTHFVSSPIRGGTGGAPAGGGTPPRGGRARCRGRASPRWRLASSPPPGAAAARPGGRANAHCRRRRAGKWHSRRRMPPCRFPPPFLPPPRPPTSPPVASPPPATRGCSHDRRVAPDDSGAMAMAPTAV